MNVSRMNNWYKGLYIDVAPIINSAKPYALLHKEKTKEAFILIHGYTGFPGELISIANTIFNEGYDVYVPRSPGCGTSTEDFSHVLSTDWVYLIINGINDLKIDYEKINLLGHSLGGIVACINGVNNPSVDKIIYIAPAFKDNLHTEEELEKCLELSKTTPYVKLGWTPNLKLHPHYENAENDNKFYGENYWSYRFNKQLLELNEVEKIACDYLYRYPKQALFINPLKDNDYSIPSLEVYKDALKEKALFVDIPNGTHILPYDEDPNAEEMMHEAIRNYIKKKNSID